MADEYAALALLLSASFTDPFQTPHKTDAAEELRLWVRVALARYTGSSTQLQRWRGQRRAGQLKLPLTRGADA